MTYFRILLIQKAKYGSGLGHISMNDIINFEIPVPPLKVQETIIKNRRFKFKIYPLFNLFSNFTN
jgi:hypothetical protein